MANALVKRRPGLLVMCGVVLAYAWMAFVVLDGDVVYSGDYGIKFVQAQSLADSGFRSLSIPYRAAFLDPEGRFSPFRPPFVFMTPTGPQAIFPPAAAVLQAMFVSFGGLYGMRLLSLISAVAILWVSSRLVEERTIPWIPLVVGLATPLWFYAVTESEHAPAVALGGAAFIVASTAGSSAAAGLLLGAGAAIRDEVALLLPGLLVAIWLKSRSWRALTLAIGGFLAPLALMGCVEVFWFGRPLAAHLQHAVHLLRGAAHLTDAPNPELPELAPFTVRQRYETVVQYWLLGYGNNAAIAVFSGMLLVGVAVRLIWRSRGALLVALAAIIGLAMTDAAQLMAAPKWVAGLYRLSPFLLFAILPPPPGATWGGWLRRTAALTLAGYAILAFAGADTSGGKSLGPRLLLPLLPLLAAAAMQNIAEHVRAPRRDDRAIGWAGMVLVVIAFAIHLGSTVPAYLARNAQDAKFVRAIAATSERLIVADDMFTAQQLLPLYYRRLVLLADSTGAGEALGAVLDHHRFPGALIVSRLPNPAIGLPPLHRQTVIPGDRFVAEMWRP